MFFIKECLKIGNRRPENVEVNESRAEDWEDWCGMKSNGGERMDGL